MRSAALVPVLGLVWGLNWPAARIVLEEFGPWTLRSVGLSLAALILFGISALRGLPLGIPRRDRRQLVLVGLLSVAAFNILVAVAQLTTPTSRTAIVTFTMPIWATLLARIVLKEPFTPLRLAGLGLGMVGLGILAWPLARDHALSPGLLWALLAGVGWAIGTVLLKRRPLEMQALPAAAWQLAVAAAFITVGMLVFEGVPAWHPPRGRTVAAFAYHVVVAQAGGYLLWFHILSTVPVGVASIGSLLVPAVGTLGAMALLGERPTAADIVGLAIIVAASAAVLLPRPGPAPRG